MATKTNSETTPGFPKWARISTKRKAHIQRVVRVLEEWAAVLEVGRDARDRWLRAAYFHDSLKDADRNYLKEMSGSDWDHSLRHGPAAAVVAEREGEHDHGVLDAVRYHSVGFEGWDDVGKMLYMADFLEPGRRFRPKARQNLAAMVIMDTEVALFEVTRTRISWAVESGWSLASETMEFWNYLVRKNS